MVTGIYSFLGGKIGFHALGLGFDRQQKNNRKWECDKDFVVPAMKVP